MIPSSGGQVLCGVWPIVLLDIGISDNRQMVNSLDHLPQHLFSDLSYAEFDIHSLFLIEDDDT